MLPLVKALSLFVQPVELDSVPPLAAFPAIAIIAQQLSAIDVIERDGEVDEPVVEPLASGCPLCFTPVYEAIARERFSPVLFVATTLFEPLAGFIKYHNDNQEAPGLIVIVLPICVIETPL